MAKDPEVMAHQQWLGYVQPVGLVVSIPAMVQAQAYVNRNIAPDHQRFLNCLPDDDTSPPAITDLARFTQEVLGWEAADLIDLRRDTPDVQSLEVTLPEYHETLRPTHGVREFTPQRTTDHGQLTNPKWLMLIQQWPLAQDLDKNTAAHDGHWQATPQARIERLLRETQVPTGLLFNGTELRLVYAPRGESSGHMTFRVKEMAEVAGRPIFAGLHMLLCAERLFSLPEKQRLPAILADSRKYQNVVSTQLAEQVLAALFELLRGFQAADAQRRGELLREVLAADPNHVYGGLLNVLMRLVFILYAEDRGLLSGDSVYANFYSVTGLFERLREDAGRYPDTMDQRYGAWAQLLTLFRLIYDGGQHDKFHVPPRRGYLFDPDRYPFLEGRAWKSRRQPDEKLNVPHVSDGVLFRVLSNLLILDGERLSYRTLDVEQIGSVYEAVMGFHLQVAEGRSIAIKPTKSHGAPATINLEALLEQKQADRLKWLAEQTDQKFTGQAADGLKKAESLEDLLAALEKKIARYVTPNVVPKGAMVLQPSDERRRSGSHYTPRSLTEPIVRTTLRPILEQLSQSPSPLRGEGRGEGPTPEQILELNVCDPAMGSGAFLVETCRQLGDELVKAWHVHNCAPKLPPDEDEVLHARRLIAQRCLYGVDKNPMAVDLAKLSLWLATLAKDHPFTFLDHTLRCGDSLVGLSREQIAAFHWQPPAKRAKDDVWFGDPIAERMRTVTEYRQRILAARDDKPYEQLRQELDVADEALALARLAGDAVIAAYFSAGKDRERVAKLNTLARQLVTYLGPQGRIEDRQPLTEAVASLHRGDPQSGDHPLQPFHWQIEFPEVFTVDTKGKPTGGFDAIVGNPPFAGGVKISGVLGAFYLSWLKTIYVNDDGNADLVSYFFRQTNSLLGQGACAGLIATNTIAQGDTRRVGLRFLVQNGAVIYAAERRFRWPGAAAVVVSVVHFSRVTTGFSPRAELDGKSVQHISSYLVANACSDDPAVLSSNANLCFRGVVIFGAGFILETEEARALIARDERNALRVLPFLTGEDVNGDPNCHPQRFVIDFGTLSLEDASKYPDLLSIVEERVKPERDSHAHNAIALRQKEYWWRFRSDTPQLKAAISEQNRVLVISQVSGNCAFAYVPTGSVYSHALNVFALEAWSAGCVLQCRVHEAWARFFGSSMKDDLRYTSTDCFETFPFPAGVLEHNAAGDSPPPDNPQLLAIESAGREYYEFRAALMVRNNEGLTKTYNRFHDPHETSPDIRKLRELHAAMDRAVLEAYGWHDLTQRATWQFLLDYEDDEDEEEITPQPAPRGRGRKKPWRYRWPDDFRDEVLARLLALNKDRAEQERLAGQSADAAMKRQSKRGHGKTGGRTQTKHLPGM